MQLLLTLMSIFRRVQSLTEQLQDKDTEKPEGEFTGLLLNEHDVIESNVYIVGHLGSTFFRSIYSRPAADAQL